MNYAPAVDFAPFGRLRSLDRLSIEGWPRGIPWSALPELPNLRSLRLGSWMDPDALGGISNHLPDLAELILVGPVVANLTPVSEMNGLELLMVLGAARQTVDLRPLAGKSLRVELSRRGRYVGLDELGEGVLVRWVN